MTHEEMCLTLLSWGCLEYGMGMCKYNGRAFQWRSLPGMVCETNKKPPFVKVYAYPDIDHVEIEITGERNGLWIEAKVYSVTREDLVKRNKEIFLAVSGMWDGFTASQITLKY